MGMKKQKVGVVVVDYKDSPDTGECLDSLLNLKTDHNYLVYLVVVKSIDGKKFENHKIKPIVLERKDNFGFSFNHNVGIMKALSDGCEVVVMLNNDTKVDSKFLDPLVNATLKTDVGLVSPKIYFYPNREFHLDSYKEAERGKVIWYAGGVIDWQNVYGSHWGVDEVDHGQFDSMTESDFATGCCLAVSAEVIEKVGLMDDEYFLYWEDVGWSVRVNRAGYKVVFEPKSIIWHKNAGSTGGSGSKLHQYYQTRNRVRFAMKYAPYRSKLAVVRESIKILKSGTKTKKNAVWHAMISRYGTL